MLRDSSRWQCESAITRLVGDFWFCFAPPHCFPHPTSSHPPSNRPAIVLLCDVGAFIPISFLWSLPRGFSALNVKLNEIPRGLPPRLTPRIRRTLPNLIGILLPSYCFNSSKIHLVLTMYGAFRGAQSIPKPFLPSKSSPYWENWDVTPGREAGLGETCGRSHRAVAAPLEQHRPSALPPLDAPR